MNFSKLLFTSIAVVIVAALAYYVITIPDVNDDLTVVTASMDTDASGERVVRATLKNDTEEDFTDVKVEIGLVDEEENPVGRAMVQTDVIPAGESWDLSVRVRSEEAADFKIISIITAQDELVED